MRERESKIDWERVIARAKMGSTGGECGIGLKVERTAVGYVITGLKHKYPAHMQVCSLSLSLHVDCNSTTLSSPDHGAASLDV